MRPAGIAAAVVAIGACASVPVDPDIERITAVTRKAPLTATDRRAMEGVVLEPAPMLAPAGPRDPEYTLRSLSEHSTSRRPRGRASRPSAMATPRR